MWPAEAGTLHPGGGGVEWVKVGRWRVSYNRTWTSIGHVARVSPAPLSRDNQAACSGAGRHGDRSAPGEVTRANSWGPQGGAALSVLQGGGGRGGVGAPKDPWRFPVSCPQGPLCDCHPASSHLIPPRTIPVQLLFPDFEPEFIKLPGLSYTLPH